MNWEKKKAKIPWLKVFLQGYRGGIPWIVGGTIIGLPTLIDRDFYGPIGMGVGSVLGVFAVATGKGRASTLGLLLISLPLAWYGGKASWHVIVNYPKTIQWCRESTKLHETVDELQKKVDKGLNG